MRASGIDAAIVMVEQSRRLVVDGGGELVQLDRVVMTSLIAAAERRVPPHALCACALFDRERALAALTSLSALKRCPP